MSNNKSLEPLFTKEEVAQYLKVSKRTVDRLFKRLNITPLRILGGRSIRVTASQVLAMLENASMTEHQLNELLNDLYGG